jgi:hypothetical protein
MLEIRHRRWVSVVSASSFLNAFTIVINPLTSKTLA